MLASRYHDTVVLLHVTDRLSPRTLAGRFGASVDEIRAVLIEAGALDTSAMAQPQRQAAPAPLRRPYEHGSLPQFFDDEERARAELRHVNGVIRALGGHGFPYLQISSRAA